MRDTMLGRTVIQLHVSNEELVKEYPKEAFMVFNFGDGIDTFIEIAQLRFYRDDNTYFFNCYSEEDDDKFLGLGLEIQRVKLIFRGDPVHNYVPSGDYVHPKHTNTVAVAKFVILEEDGDYTNSQMRIEVDSPDIKDAVDLLKGILKKKIKPVEEVRR